VEDRARIFFIFYLFSLMQKGYPSDSAAYTDPNLSARTHSCPSDQGGTGTSRRFYSTLNRFRHFRVPVACSTLMRCLRFTSKSKFRNYQELKEEPAKIPYEFDTLESGLSRKQEAASSHQDALY
jgi:hypothetical protein